MATASNRLVSGFTCGAWKVQKREDIREHRRRLHVDRTNQRPACPVLPWPPLSWRFRYVVVTWLVWTTCINVTLMYCVILNFNHPPSVFLKVVVRSTPYFQLVAGNGRMDDVRSSGAALLSALLALVPSGWAQTIRLWSIDACPEILLRDSRTRPGRAERKKATKWQVVRPVRQS
jgi:hypothetical protein